MSILVNRFLADADTTVSTISINGLFFCFGLEDEYREEKIAGETRIPIGNYKVGVKTTGGFHNRYQNKFGDMHKGMLQVMEVENFTDILIHVGNTHEDTAGCLLVGMGVYADPGNMSIQASVLAYRRLYEKVIDEALAGDLTISYRG